MNRSLLTPLVLVATLTVLVVTPAPALAKGATSVTVTGPGVIARTLDYTPAAGDVDLGTVAEASGLYGIFGDGMLGARPDLAGAELGPRYVLTWYQGSSVLAVSHVYPFATGGAWAHVPRGQELFDLPMEAGWWRGGRALEEAMVRVGALEPAAPLVATAPEVSNSAASGTTTPGVSPVLAASLVLTAGLILLLVGWVISRRRAIV